MNRFFFLVLLFALQTSTAQDTITVNVDFGNNTSFAPWNNLTLPRTGSLTNLIDNFGFPTSIQIAVDDAFNGINNSGTTDPDPVLGIPGTASGDSFFGNRDSFSNVIEITGGLLLSGLDTNKRYDLDLFASRLANDNRETQYNISSTTKDTLFLQVTNNTDTWTSLQNLQARPDGTIHIEATTGPNNTNAFGFFYLGALRLQYTDTLEPVQRSLSLLHPNGGEYWQPGQPPEIRWQSLGNPIVQIEYSIDEGDSWQLIDSVAGVRNGYAWTIPDTPSEKCLVRISADSLVAQSEQIFTIAEEDTARCQIVILGSSTAAGTGPSVRDSAWVWKYRDYLFQKDTRFRVTNLARGGFTTYNILPTGIIIPDGINQSIDTARNMTKALTFDPDAIIINLPSNDAANNYPVEDQLRNYEEILAPTLTDSIPVWVCTPQPRNFGTNAINLQLALRDSTFARYGTFAIDFWNGFADSTQRIDPRYDSGDGVHLNNAGHRLLFERIFGAQVDSFLLAKKTTPIISEVKHLTDHPLQLEVFPNPTRGQLVLSYQQPKAAQIRLQIVTFSGKIIREMISPRQSSGKHQLQLSIHDLSSGVYFCLLEINGTRNREIIRFVVGD